jgi:hypothetical protein
MGYNKAIWAAAHKLSKITGNSMHEGRLSGMCILSALAQGQSDPEQLAQLAGRHLRFGTKLRAA